MFWCDLFKCKKCDIEKINEYIDIYEAGCKSNCELCLFSKKLETTSESDLDNIAHCIL